VAALVARVSARVSSGGVARRDARLGLPRDGLATLQRLAAEVVHDEEVYGVVIRVVYFVPFR
jgi:hypothetical protein